MYYILFTFQTSEGTIIALHLVPDNINDTYFKEHLVDLSIFLNMTNQIIAASWMTSIIDFTLIPQ